MFHRKNISFFLYEKIDKLFHGLPNVFAIFNDILIAGLDYLGRDDEETLDKVLVICRKANLKLNNEKCHFNSFLFYITGWQDHTLRNLKALRCASTQMQVRAPIIPRHDQLFKQVLANNCRSLWTTKKTHISKVRVVVEWDISRPIWQGQEINHKGCLHKILWHFKALVLGDRCIWHKPCYQFVAPVRGYELQVRKWHTMWLSSQLHLPAT